LVYLYLNLARRPSIPHAPEAGLGKSSTLTIRRHDGMAKGAFTVWEEIT